MTVSALLASHHAFVFVPSLTAEAMSLLAPVFYVACVFAGIEYMRSRAPVRLRWFPVIHSALLCVASALMFAGLVYGAWVRTKEASKMALFCDFNRSPPHGPLAYWMYVYWLSKFPELLDTAILIAKKKNIIFLHVFHHATMLTLPYQWMAANWTLVWFGCAFNCAIHVFMYFYYAGAAYNGYNPWWKKLLTAVQIVQFISVLIASSTFQIVVAVLDEPCNGGNSIIVWVSQAVNLVFLLFFARFFVGAYLTDDKEKL